MVLMELISFKIFKFFLITLLVCLNISCSSTSYNRNELKRHINDKNFNSKNFNNLIFQITNAPPKIELSKKLINDKVINISNYFWLKGFENFESSITSNFFQAINENNKFNILKGNNLYPEYYQKKFKKNDSSSYFYDLLSDESLFDNNNDLILIPYFKFHYSSYLSKADVSTYITIDLVLFENKKMIYNRSFKISFWSNDVKTFMNDRVSKYIWEQVISDIYE